MEKITSKMDSVFDDVANSVTDFDVMFDDDDHLVDVVEGFASNGKPLTGDEFEDIHLSDDEKGDPDSTFDLDDDCDPNDIKDTLGGRDDLFGSSLKDVENGSEWDIDNNNKYFKNEEKDAGEKWFEDSDKKYQDSDFHGSVDPENINKSLEAQREAAAFLESDEEEPEDESFDWFSETKKSDDDDEEDKSKDDEEDLESEDESFDWFSEDTVHDDIDSTSDIMDKNPKDHFDLEDEDDPVSRKDDTETDDGVGELDEAAAFLDSDEEEPEDESFDWFSETKKSDDDDEEDLESEDESFDWFSENDEGMLADNNEADVHSDVQCDGTESCNCPMCREKKLNDSELAVGDTFAQEAKAFMEEEDADSNIPEQEDADITDDNDENQEVIGDCGDNPAKAFERDQYLESAAAFMDAPDVTNPVMEADEDLGLVDPVEDLEDDIVDDTDKLP